MDNSILNCIKKLLGIDAEYDIYDSDIIVYINSVFLTLSQLGVGPTKPFHIEDSSSTWYDFLGEDRYDLEAVKTYIYLKVRLIFDPPSSSFVLDAINSLIKEQEWRLNIQVEKE